MKTFNLKTFSLSAVIVVGWSICSHATILVDNFGVNGWYSADTRNTSGTTLNGLLDTQGGTGTTGDDIQIAQQIQFAAEGSSPSATANPLTMTGTLGGAGALELSGTTANNGKSQIARVNLAGFGATADLLGSSFYADYRATTLEDSTFRTPGLNIYVQGTNGSTYVFVYQDPSAVTGTFTTANVTDASLFTLHGPSASGTLSLADWATDPTFGSILFGDGSIVTEYGFTLGSSQRNAYAYIDWTDSNIIDGGELNDFVAPVPEPSVITLTGLSSLILVGINRFRRKS